MEIKLDKSLYEKAAIQSACQAYKEAGIGKFSLKEENGSFTVKVKDDNKENKEELIDNFLNYVIAEM